VRDIVGAVLNPPAKALVLSVDREKAKSRRWIVRNRFCPSGRSSGRQTHDYERHGTTTLFAALNVLDGTIIGQCQPRHRHQEFGRFLNRVDKVIGSVWRCTSSWTTTGRTSIRG